MHLLEELRRLRGVAVQSGLTPIRIHLTTPDLQAIKDYFQQHGGIRKGAFVKYPAISLGLPWEIDDSRPSGVTTEAGAAMPDAQQHILVISQMNDLGDYAPTFAYGPFDNPIEAVTYEHPTEEATSLRSYGKAIKLIRPTTPKREENKE